MAPIGALAATVAITPVMRVVARMMGVAIAVMVHPVAVVIAIRTMGVMIAVAIAVIGRRGVFLVGRLRRKRTRAAIGRTLVDVVILRRGLGQMLIAIAGDSRAATAAAAIGRRRDVALLVGVGRRIVGGAARI